MSPEEHAVKIREGCKLILRLLAAKKYSDIVAVLNMIEEEIFNIQTGK